MARLPIHLLAVAIGLALVGCAASGESLQGPSTKTSTAFGASYELLHVLDALAGLFSASDVTILPSLWSEPFGLAAVEAMASGVPVVAYSSGALPEVVGDAGVLVPAGDQAALAAALVGLLEDVARRRRLSELGLQRVTEHYNYEKQTDALFEVFDSVARGAE